MLTSHAFGVVTKEKKMMSSILSIIILLNQFQYDTKRVVFVREKSPHEKPAIE